MKLDELTAKDRIFQIAMELVMDGKSNQQITTREIALKAGVNLALVNYYYQSKDNLLSQVVGTIMSNIVNNSNPNNHEGTDAQLQLKSILNETADAAFKYRNICEIALSLELKSGCENSCKLVKPLLKEILPEYEESDLNIIALQLMLPFHLIVLNPEVYNVFLNTDFFNGEKRKQKINQMIDCVILGRDVLKTL